MSLSLSCLVDSLVYRYLSWIFFDFQNISANVYNTVFCQFFVTRTCVCYAILSLHANDHRVRNVRIRFFLVRIFQNSDWTQENSDQNTTNLDIFHAVDGLHNCLLSNVIHFYYCHNIVTIWGRNNCLTTYSTITLINISYTEVFFNKKIPIYYNVFQYFAAFVIEDWTQPKQFRTIGQNGWRK